jgi:hypothetical protein
MSRKLPTNTSSKAESETDLKQYKRSIGEILWLIEPTATTTGLSFGTGTAGCIITTGRSVSG